MQLVRKRNSLAIVVVLYLQVFTSPFHKYYQHCTDCYTIQREARQDDLRVRRQNARNSSHAKRSNHTNIKHSSNETIVVSDLLEPVTTRRPHTAAHHKKHNETQSAGEKSSGSTIVISDPPDAKRESSFKPSNETFCERLARRDAGGSVGESIPMFCVDYANCPSLELMSSSRVRHLTCGLKFDGTIRVCCGDFDRGALTEEELTGGRVVGEDETFNQKEDDEGFDVSELSRESKHLRVSEPDAATRNITSTSASGFATVIVNETQTLSANVKQGRVVEKPATNQTIASKFPKNCGLAQDGYNNRDELRIIGGKSARRNAWPWFALLMVKRRRRFEPECGATLITDRHVLTAAHCVLIQGKRPIPVHQLTVRLGEFNLKEANDGEQDFAVESVVAHPEFNPRTFRNDIALVKLSKNVSQFTESIAPACLAGLNEPKLSSLMLDAVDNRTAWVLGFGQTSYNGRTSDQLRQADLKIVPHAKCKRAFAHLVKLTRDYVCASSQYDDSGDDASDSKAAGKIKDSCQGDSGGPLMMMAAEEAEPSEADDSRQLERWYVYGIVSFGFKCAVPNFAGVYCRVNRYLEWIWANTNF